ncbi:metallopeptidase family protein [Corynebacterium glyciniphilum]|uniref:metallopeptidase family protein n=1 Tax=Corynebacterium glyciniphilum TaxID=1404244 RepID=UPI0026526C99|nr:metallopeptidase family protein [Corynebacterium glyciniphilum]MDN5683360.1 metallopeptidase family protein [Corynebacterium glyciniphilum]MDN6705905.1 metallopeptidase family protein [Corynebacterium glyciniphilum]
MIEVSDDDFEDLVDRGLRLIPRQLLDALDNVAIVVEDHNDEDPSILGLYHGVALTERSVEWPTFLPDKISIYKDALCRHCSTHEQLVEEVAVTVVHEIGHHFGIDDARLHELGWG